MVRMSAFPGDCLDIRRIKESNRKGLKVSVLRGEKFHRTDDTNRY
jgi:hypothetical protein